MSDEELRDIFENNRTIAVVGLSSNNSKASHNVTKFIQSKGYGIIPVNPKEKEVLGEIAYPSLDSISEKVDMVQIFRRPEFAPELVDEAIKMGARVVWMQDGAGNKDAAEKAKEAGLKVVVNDCMLRQYVRLNGIKPIENK